MNGLLNRVNRPVDDCVTFEDVEVDNDEGMGSRLSGFVVHYAAPQACKSRREWNLGGGNAYESGAVCGVHGNHADVLLIHMHPHPTRTSPQARRCILCMCIRRTSAYTYIL